MKRDFVLAIDQGTTSSRAILFDRDGRAAGTGQKELPQHFPRDGWVEHDPEDIWRDTLAVCRQAIAAAGIAARRDRGHRHHQPARDHLALGARHRQRRPQRHRLAGPPHRRGLPPPGRGRRSRPRPRRAPASSSTPTSRAPRSPGCSTTSPAPARARRERRPGLRHGRQLPALAADRRPRPRHRRHQRLAHHAVRHRDQRWDASCCAALRHPAAVLPEVRDCSGDFGTTEPRCSARAIPILGVAGDQQAATVGQACFEPGMSKSTYGTGCFALVNTGERLRRSRNRLLTTVAYRLGGRTTYALEGSIFVAGAAIQWLRDGLRRDRRAAASEALARDLRSTRGRLPRPGLHRPRRPVLGPRRPRRDPRADPRQRRRPHRARRPGGGRPTRPPTSPTPWWPTCATAARPTRPGHAPGRRRHGGQRLAVPVPGRHAATARSSGRR